LGLAHVFFEVPQVHRSISPHGVDDPSLTKSAVIRAALDHYQRAIAYVDVDAVVRDQPLRLSSFAAAGKDFAIYNWLADEHTDAFKAVPDLPHAPPPTIQRARYLCFSHGIYHFGTEQLMCSGMTQFYGNTLAARALLEAWANVIAQQPGVADDLCLDFAFNNNLAGVRLSTSWLDKAYARIPWWIYVRPIIDHPDPPGTGEGFTPLKETTTLRHRHLDRLELRKGPHLIPRDCLIDVQQRALYRAQARKPGGDPELVLVGPLETRLFI
jgi:hypothetical protein